MKIRFLLLLAISAASITIQAQELQEKQLVLQKVIDFPNMSRKEIYLKSKEYIVYNYNNSNYTLKLDDEESGKLISKGIFKDFHINNVKWQLVNFRYKFTMNHTITIKCKEAKAQMTIESNEVTPNINGHDWHTFTFDEVYPTIQYKGYNKKQAQKGFAGVYEAACETMNAMLKGYIEYVNKKDDDF